MCGIIGAVSQRNVARILLDGLKRLEYRGYDSAGMALMDAGNNQPIQRIRVQGKVNQLQAALAKQPLHGGTGIAHTRWATHGEPTEQNAHPHMSSEQIALVHNGIIENHEALKERLLAQGYQFSSETDTEIIAHLIHAHYQNSSDLLVAVQATVRELEGAFALGIMHAKEPGRLIAARCGSPLVLGVGIEEMFIVSDKLALLPITQRFLVLEDHDVADITANAFSVYDQAGKQVERAIDTLNVQYDAADRGKYRHYMQKEIFEQPTAISSMLEARLGKSGVYERAFGDKAPQLFDRVEQVQITACGTSYHAGLVARYWLEGLAGIPCQVEVASEYRYRPTVVSPNTLFIVLSQSGETADTLAALRKARTLDYVATLAICNVPGSSLVREADYVLMTKAGIEVGVASTKAFTTQLVALLLLTMVLGSRRQMGKQQIGELIKQLGELPVQVSEVLALDAQIKQLSTAFIDKQHALYLGRGLQLPIAMEGALKLKEISYIHAQAYPAGELKHGPLALVDTNMPVVVLMPRNALLGKLKATLSEVQARGGELIVFADQTLELTTLRGLQVLAMPVVEDATAPIVYAVALQLLAYHAAVLRGTDVDQPRNLAKSVTVE